MSGSGRIRGCYRVRIQVLRAGRATILTLNRSRTNYLSEQIQNGKTVQFSGGMIPVRTRAQIRLQRERQGDASLKSIGLAFGSLALGFRSEVPMENNFN
jgi:hypothetical protein